MALRKRSVALPFGGGLDVSGDHKQVPPVKLIDLQNCVFSGRPGGPAKLKKRNGYETLATVDNAVGLAARGDELLIFDGAHAYSYRESSGTTDDTGETASVVASATPIARTGTVQVIPDVALRNGIQVAAWEDSRGGIYCSVLEESSRRILVAATLLDASGENPRCVYADEVIHILWTRSATNRIYIATVNTASPTTTPTASILTSDLSGTYPYYDAESVGPDFISGQEPAVIAWALNGGGFRVGYLHASGVLGSPLTGLPSVASFGSDSLAGPIAVTPDRYNADTVAVIWTTATAISVRILDSDPLLTTRRSATLGGAISSPLRITAAWGRLVDSEACLWWALQTSPSRTDLATIVSGKALRTSTTYDATTTTLLGHTLLSRAFYDGPELRPSAAASSTPTGDVYAMAAHGARFYSYAACIRLSADSGITGGDTVCVARLLPGESPPTHFRRISSGASGFEEVAHLSSVVERDRVETDVFSRKHAVPLTYRIQLDSEDGDQFGEAGIKYVTLDFDHDASYQTAEFGRGLYLAGACPQHYDGDRWTEAGYHAAPDWGHNADGSAYAASSAFSVQNVGGGMAAGTYLYRFWYENVDAQGELHPGPTSVSVLVTLAAGEDQVTIAIPTLKLTSRRRVRICVARSIAGQTADTDPDTVAFYRVTDTDPATNTGANRYIENDPTTATVTFIDSLSDDDLIEREPLYTNGGILSNDPAPWGGNVIASGKGRLFWNDPSDPYMLRFSQERREETACEPPVGLWLQVPPETGPIVGAAVLDDTVIVFTRDGMHYFAGPGPKANPSSQPEAYAFTPPARLPSDAGCSSPASISVTPIGAVLQTTKGIAVVTRERQVIQIGDDVEAYEAQTFVRATALPERSQLLLLTASGSSLLYDYEHKQWSRFTYHEGYDAVILDGEYVYLRTDGRIFRETEDEYADGNSHISMAIETAWIKFVGYLQGFQKVIHAKVIGEYISAHSLRVSYRLDYAPGYSNPVTIDCEADYDPDYYGEGAYGVGPYGGDGGYDTVYAQSVHINRRCKAISFKFEDVEDADDYGASFELTELLLTGGVLRSDYPAGATRSQ